MLMRLRSIIKQELDSLIPKGASVALLDFPHYSNVGDSAIWLGQINYLAYRKCKIVYTADVTNFSAAAMKRALPDGIILLQGGGNFGDLYPQHQYFRQEIIKKFPNHRIVQFPQSIHFDTEQSIESSSLLLSKHPDFHLLVRDQTSMSMARRHSLGSVRLCPDMAMMLNLVPFSRFEKKMNVVVLSRTDKEKQSSPPTADSAGARILISDWLGELPPRREPLYRWSHDHLSRSYPKITSLLLNRLALYAANNMAHERLQRGVQLLRQAEVVVTDRLHAAIISFLGGTPVVYLDNSYGKLSNFFTTWQLQENMTQATSFAVALNTGLNIANALTDEPNGQPN